MLDNEQLNLKSLGERAKQKLIVLKQKKEMAIKVDDAAIKTGSVNHIEYLTHQNEHKQKITGAGIVKELLGRLVRYFKKKSE